MKKKLILMGMLIMSSAVYTSHAQHNLQEKKIPVDLAVEAKTTHIWRGLEVTDNLLMDVNARITNKDKTLAAGVWGATTFAKDFKEFNYYVGMYKSGLSLEVWDIFNFSPKNQYSEDNLGGYNTEDAFNYSGRETGRFVDVRLAYQFGESFPLRLGWNTVVFGRDRSQITKFHADNTFSKKVSSSRYSTYVEAEYPILRGDLVDVKLGVAAAFALKEAKIDGEKIKGNFYGDKNGFANANLTVSKNIKVTDNYTLPIAFTGVWNTMAKKTYLQVALQVLQF